MSVGIIGGGMMGMALGERLSATGHRVEIFERNSQIGGLATWEDFGGFYWDRFYHVILPTDGHLTEYLGKIGLADQIRWQDTRTGFYVDGTLHSVSTTLEFLSFPPLSLPSKLRLAATILYCAALNDWRRLERITVEDWLIKISGRITYEKFWKPLLLAKLGENYRRVSAVFIWTYIKRLYAARSSSAKREQLGHVSGGYKRVFDRLVELIENQGGKVHTGVAVTKVTPAPSAGVEIQLEGQTLLFDKVIFTGPVNVLQRVAAADLVEHPGTNGGVEYLGVVCLVLVTSKPIVPFYVVNIADPRIPFTGIIGMSNVVSARETGGKHMTYLPKYVLSDDAALKRADDDICAEFIGGLQLMLPDFDHDSIVSFHVQRASKVQPLQVLNYSQLAPRAETQHPDFYILNTAQFVRNTLNNNEVIGLVNGFLDRHQSEFAPSAVESIKILATVGQQH